MRHASAVLSLSLWATSASLAPAAEPAPEFVLFHHVCITENSVAACSCAFPLLALHVPGDRLNAELKTHGGEFFVRSPLASLVEQMVRICAPKRPNISSEARE